MKYFYIITGLVLALSGIVGAQGEWPRLGMTLLFAGLMSGWQGAKEWRESRTKEHELAWKDVGELEQERIELLQESYTKAVADCASIEEARRQISDVELSRQLGKMQQIAGNMLRYLEKNPQKLPLAQRFIDYYQDRAVLLVRKYREFEATELQTGRVQEMKERMKAALNGLDEAYEEQFERILSDQFIDLDAEIKVMQQALDADGIQRTTQTGDTGQAPASPLGNGDLSGKLQGTLMSKFPSASGKNLPSRIPEEQRGDVLLTKLIQSSLAIVLGSFGAHKFYQGKTFQGVLYCLFCWTLLPGFIGFCEGIRYLCMKMDDFYTDYYTREQ